MATGVLESRFSPGVAGLLAGVRGRIRRYVWLQGLAATVACLGFAFWISLGIDWFFEPPLVARYALQGVVALAALAVLYRFVFRRAFVSLPDQSMAILVERRYRDLSDRLVTTVELSGRAAPGPLYREMLSHTAATAEADTRRLNPAEVFNPAPLTLALAAAGALVAGIVAYALADPRAFSIWADRNLTWPLSNELWPRNTQLSIEGFDDNRSRKIARGDDLTINVLADTDWDIPDTVQISYRSEEGQRGKANMKQEGRAAAGSGQPQKYSYAFRGVLSPIRFDLKGGDDDRLRDYRIEVVDSPTIAEMSLDCVYPTYTQKLPATLSNVSGAASLVQGTKIKVRCRANKPLVKVSVSYVLNKVEGREDTVRTDELTPASADGLAFDYELTEPFVADKTLSFMLLDSDGIRNREAIRLSLTAVADQPPEMDVRPTGLVELAVTPVGRLPWVGKMTDDFGLARTWFDHVVDDAPPAATPFGKPADPNQPTLSRDVDNVFEVEPLKLKPGQKLRLGIKAQDTFDLAAPHVAGNERTLLEVVTADRLRVLLDARELMLRKRLETIIQEIRDDREILGKVDPAGKSAPTAPGETAAPLTPARILEQNTQRVDRTLQDGERSAHELLEVATAFDSIREQLTNNRIDSEPLKRRLKDGIADPLKAVSAQRFPELAKRLQSLKDKLTDAAAVPANRAAADEQYGIILDELNTILTRMLELETFNEAVDLLREIISKQEKLNEETDKQRKDKVKDLLK